MIVLMDMDGVLVDFVGGICRAHGREWPYHDRKNLGEYDTAKVIGMAPEKFWRPCNRQEFWEQLEWTEDGTEILDAAEKLLGPENVYLLTSPTISAGAYAGKFAWVEQNLPHYKRRLLMGACKHLCALEGTVLVDDSDKNVEDFRRAGGEAILVPRPWNANYECSTFAAQWVKGSLNALTEATEEEEVAHAR
jgi:5'(3')-deoxyribonucleotidase